MATVGFWEGHGRRPTGGMEYGMALDLAKRLGLEHVAVRTEDFSAIVAGHLDGADIALSLITPTDVREQVLDFSTPYIQAAPALLTRAGTDVPDVKTAQGLRWTVGKNTTFEQTLADAIRPDEPPLQFEDRDQEIRAVQDHRADAALFDLPAAQAIVSAHPGLAIAAKLADTEPIAAALPKGSDNVEAVSSALRAMQADGTIDDLAKRWLGPSISDMESDVALPDGLLPDAPPELAERVGV